MSARSLPPSVCTTRPPFDTSHDWRDNGDGMVKCGYCDASRSLAPSGALLPECEDNALAREPLSAEREAEIVARLGYDPIGHLRRAIGDPGTFTPRGDNFTEPVTSWQARAVMAAIGENLFEELDAHAEANHELYTEVKRLRARVAELEQHTTTARTEAIADVGDWLDEIGQKDAAHLVYTCDIPVARDMKVVSQQAAEAGDVDEMAAPGCPNLTTRSGRARPCTKQAGHNGECATEAGESA